MLVFTPKGNVPVVGNFLKQIRLLLDHPLWPFDYTRFKHYQNPHNPPPGGHVQASLAHRTVVPNRWNTQIQTGKSVEIQRSQVDDLFRSLKDGDELEETEASAFHVCYSFVWLLILPCC
jgi:SWI/SNF-related matrix-associated actin-dependent regulator of chromatin subfamily A3